MIVVTMFLCLVIQEVLDDTTRYGNDDWGFSIFFITLISFMWPITLTLIVMGAIGFALKKFARVIGDKIRNVL
jgi:hypothetical protein